ncbi:hypothetical protein ACFE04_014090 [Oxalis oulophora]
MGKTSLSKDSKSKVDWKFEKKVEFYNKITEHVTSLAVEKTIKKVPVKGEPWSAAAAAVNTLIARSSTAQQQHNSGDRAQQKHHITTATQHSSGGYTQVYKYGNSIMVENINRTF